MNFFNNQKIVGYIVLALIVFGFYDVLLHSVFMLAHSAFEWLELMLEKLIEHFFHTSRKQSQVIVFYLFVSVTLLVIYRLWLLLPLLIFRFKGYLSVSWLRYKKQPLIKKIKILTVCFFGMSFVVFFAVS